MVGKRFETLTLELGRAFIKVEFRGAQHSTVTEHRKEKAVKQVLAFLDDKLNPASSD